MLIYDLKYYWLRFRRKLIFLFLVLFLLVALKVPILSLLGNYLICEDDLATAQVAFVLGGNSHIRATKAAEIYVLGLVDKFICTGAHQNDMSSYFDVPESEAQLSKGFLEQMSVPGHKVEAMRSGTSTAEESDYILKKCLQNDWSKIMIISDRFHTRRINQIFKKKFKENSIEIVIIGVANDKYEEEKYWQNEKGFVMVIMEYIKLVHTYVI